MMFDSDKHGTTSIRDWLIASTVMLVCLAALIFVYSFYDESDYAMIIRSTLQRIIGVLLVVPVMTGVLLFFNYVTPRDSFKTIGENPIAEAILYSSLALAFAYIYVFVSA
jgi:hypothetical protein